MTFDALHHAVFLVLVLAVLIRATAIIGGIVLFILWGDAVKNRSPRTQHVTFVLLILTMAALSLYKGGR